LDFRWTSLGGILLDGSGDIATTLSAKEEISTMVATRLKAATGAWKLYTIGANLKSFIGSSIGINTNTELAIKRQVTSSLSDILSAGSFSVQTINMGNEIQVLVYLGQTLLTTQTVIV